MSELRANPLQPTSSTLEQLLSLRSALRVQIRWTKEQMISEVQQTLSRMRFAKIEADVNGHYQFSALPAGEYVLFAEFGIGDQLRQWWVPIVLATGDTLRRDLDPSRAQDPESFCSLR
jgi:hypothetical protein